MNNDYTTFAAHAFGPVLAQIAREEYQGRLTPGLIHRVRRNLNLSQAAHQAVIEHARRLLAPEEVRSA